MLSVGDGVGDAEQVLCCFVAGLASNDDLTQEKLERETGFEPATLSLEG